MKLLTSSRNGKKGKKKKKTKKLSLQQHLQIAVVKAAGR